MKRACRHIDACACSTPRLLLTPADLLLKIVYHRRLNDRNGVTDGECSLRVRCHYSQRTRTTQDLWPLRSRSSGCPVHPEHVTSSYQVYRRLQTQITGCSSAAGASGFMCTVATSEALLARGIFKISLLVLRSYL